MTAKITLGNLQSGIGNRKSATGSLNPFSAAYSLPPTDFRLQPTTYHFNIAHANKLISTTEIRFITNPTITIFFIGM